MKVTTSKRFSLNKLDFLKSLSMAGIISVMASCGQIIEMWATSPTFIISKFNILLIVKAFVVGMVGYLIKNFLSPAKTIITEPTEEVSSVIDNSVK